MTTKKPIYVQPTAQKWPLIALTETIIEQIGCAMYTKTMGARHHLTTPCTDQLTLQSASLSTTSPLAVHKTTTINW